MARGTVGYTPGTGATVESYPATDGAHREAAVIVDPLVDGRPAYVTADNRLQVKMDYSAAPAVTSVAISATSVQLVAADAASGRMGVTLYNDTTQVAYILMGAGTAAITSTAPAAAHSFQIGPDQAWESPHNYVHALQCVWTSTTGSGAMRVTTY